MKPITLKRLSDGTRYLQKSGYRYLLEFVDDGRQVWSDGENVVTTNYDAHGFDIKPYVGPRKAEFCKAVLDLQDELVATFEKRGNNMSEWDF